MQSVAWMSFSFVTQGHAGVTHLSPMEAREVSDPRKIVCVFGRSPDGLPHKVSPITLARVFLAQCDVY